MYLCGLFMGCGVWFVRGVAQVVAAVKCLDHA